MGVSRTQLRQDGTAMQWWRGREARSSRAGSGAQKCDLSDLVEVAQVAQDRDPGCHILPNQSGAVGRMQQGSMVWPTIA
jgi:hypothetical protein